MPSLDVFSYVLAAFHSADPHEDIAEDLRRDIASWTDYLKFHERNLQCLEDIRTTPYKMEGETVMASVVHGGVNALRRRSKQRPTHELPSCQGAVVTDTVNQFFAELREWQEATYRIASLNTTLAYITLSRNTPPGSQDAILTDRILGAMLMDVGAFPSPPSRPYQLATIKPGDRELVSQPTRMIFDEPSLGETIASLDVGSRDYLANVAKKVRSTGPAVPRFLARATSLPTSGEKSIK